MKTAGFLASALEPRMASWPLELSQQLLLKKTRQTMLSGQRSGLEKGLSDLVNLTKVTLSNEISCFVQVSIFDLTWKFHQTYYMLSKFHPTYSLFLKYVWQQSLFFPFSPFFPNSGYEISRKWKENTDRRSDTEIDDFLFIFSFFLGALLKLCPHKIWVYYRDLLYNALQVWQSFFLL